MVCTAQKKHTMKKFIPLLCILLIPSSALYSQVTGNVAYRDSDQWKALSNSINNHQSNSTDPEDITISVHSLYNAKASGYLAIFHLTQTAPTARECDSIMNSRIDGFRESLVEKEVREVEVLSDMLSFVPVYSIEVTRKFLSKTYHEIPAGFEMQKNLHVKYEDPNQLDRYNLLYHL